MQLVDRWEKIMEAQPTREFMVGAIMGRDGIELWAFAKDGRIKHTEIHELHWEEGNVGWQVRKWLITQTIINVGIHVRICVVARCIRLC